MKSALKQVKSELGVDAVIMSNKKVAGGVEIVAAIDGEQVSNKIEQSTQRAAQASRGYFAQDRSSNQEASRSLEEDRVNLGGQGMSKKFANILKQFGQSEAESHPQRDAHSDSLSALLERQNRYREDERPLQESARRVSQALNDRRQNSTSREPQASDDNHLEMLRDDMNSIRRLLEHQVSGLMWQEVERREPLRAMLIKRLERMGLSSDLADQLACYIPEDTKPAKAWKALLSLVADQIHVTKQDILKRGGVVALLGPTGVGKTTSIAKLAARAAMEYGADNVALVTTDTYRIGAHEQLAIYGRIMGCPVKVAKDSNELADVIYQLRNRRLVLVDTAGMGQRDVRLSEQLDTLMQDSGETIYSYLVLPATAQRQVLQETIDHFKRIPLSGCILTKLDESLSLGEFISVTIQNALPIAYIANGQRVPEDIVLAQPKYMVAKANELLERSTENEPHYWNSDVEGL